MSDLDQPMPPSAEALKLRAAAQALASMVSSVVLAKVTGKGHDAAQECVDIVTGGTITREEIIDVMLVIVGAYAEELFDGHEGHDPEHCPWANPTDGVARLYDEVMARVGRYAATSDLETAIVEDARGECGGCGTAIFGERALAGYCVPCDPGSDQ